MTILSCPLLLYEAAVCYTCARRCGCDFSVFGNGKPAFKARYAKCGEVAAVKPVAHV